MRATINRFALIASETLLHATPTHQIHHGPSAATEESSDADGDHAFNSKNRSILEEDEKFEIRVEVYDPGLLRHHALTIHEGDIQRCFSANPNIYTLGRVGALSHSLTHTILIVIHTVIEIIVTKSRERKAALPERRSECILPPQPPLRETPMNLFSIKPITS